MLARKFIGFGLTQVQLLDISRGLSFLHSHEIVYGDLQGVRLDFFLRYALVGSNLTISHLRIIFSLTNRDVPDSMASVSLVSPVSTVRRLQHLDSRDPTDGWPPNSSTSTLSMKEIPASPRANQTRSL